MIAESLNIPKTVVLWILKEDLGKRKLCACFVLTPWDLSKGKIESHLAKILLQWPMQTTIFLTKLLRDETWCFAYDPKTKQQCSDWVGETSPWLKKPKFQRSRITTMLIIFFDSQGIVHKEFIPKGMTVNAEFYEVLMDCLLKRIRWVRPAAFCSRDFFLLHDNAPTHKAASVCQFLTPKNVTTLYQPPYSP
jgi:hypothetical protein